MLDYVLKRELLVDVFNFSVFVFYNHSFCSIS